MQDDSAKKKWMKKKKYQVLKFNDLSRAGHWKAHG